MRTLLLLSALLSTAFAQTTSRHAATASHATSTTATAAPAAPQNFDLELGSVLQRMNSELQPTLNDLGRLRVEKWKTDSASKQRSQSNIDSLERNLTTTVPNVIAQVKAQPNSIAANFRLYRYMNALYDVLSSVSESAGAFGKKEEYEAVAPHALALDDLRRAYGELFEKMATAQDARISASSSSSSSASKSSNGTKKVIIDDSEPAPKKKKAPAKKKPSAATPKPTQPQQ